MVSYQDSAILRRLVLEKLDADRLAGRNASRIDEGSAGKSAHPRPAGEGIQPMGNSGKGPAVNAPAKFTGLQLVHSSRCLDTANPTRLPGAAVSKHLVLVSW